MTALVETGPPPGRDLDTQLALRAGNGDREAFGDLIERNYDRIFRIAAKWCGNPTEAEDVTQDVCVKLASVVEDFDARSAFSSWLYRVVLNAVRDGQRKRVREGRRDAQFAEEQSDVLPPGQEDQLHAQDLWSAVRELPDKQRDAVLLVYAEDQSHADVAAIMDVSEATVSWYVHEARKTLKGVLK